MSNQVNGLVIYLVFILINIAVCIGGIFGIWNNIIAIFVLFINSILCLAVIKQIVGWLDVRAKVQRY